MAMPAPSQPLAGTPRIWAVGGGKGGVGKSVVTSSLAAAMAGMGRRVAVIDADLGAANLHTLLGAARPRVTLSHFLSGEVDSLAEVMVQTSVPNLWLVSGHQALIEMANPKQREKEALHRQIQLLEVDEVLLDLGAGSAFNVLDLFLLAQRGIVVVTPEPTAIENAEHFLRAAVYRSLRFVARRPDVNAAIAQLRDKHHKRRVRSAQELIALVREIDPTAAKPLEERAKGFAPMLIVNQVQSVEHRRTGPELVARVAIDTAWRSSSRRRSTATRACALRWSSGNPRSRRFRSAVSRARSRGSRGACCIKRLSSRASRRRTRERDRFRCAWWSRPPGGARGSPRCRRSISPSRAPTCAAAARRSASR